MTDTPINSKGHTKGGVRPGAGRPKGSLNKTTKEKKAIEEAFHAKILESVDTLFQSQLHIARGVQYLYKIEKYVKRNKKGEVTSVESKPPKLVTDQWEIEMYLNGVVDGSMDLQDPEDTYYFITTQLPQNQAINSMLDRVYGKSKQSVDHTTDGKALPQPILGGLSNQDDE